MRVVAHLQDNCRIACNEIQRINSIHHHLSNNASPTLISSFVPPNLGNCSSLFNDSQVFKTKKPQNVQKSADRLFFFNVAKISHISLLFMTQHWMQIDAFIDYWLSGMRQALTRVVRFILCLDTRRIYALLLAIEIYVSLNYDQRQLTIAQFMLKPLQFGIPCLLNSDILILSLIQ